MLKATIKKWQAGVDAFKAGNFSEAQNCFKSIDDMSKILYDLGIVYFKQNNYTEAASAFSKSVKCDPFLAISYFMRGAACQMRSDLANAVTHYDEAIQALRGHEFIDYKQLGMDYKLLLCEILFNKGMCLSKSGAQLAVPQLMREACNCKAIRDDKNRYRFEDSCNALAAGSSSAQPYTAPLDILFMPPKIKAEKPAVGTERGGGGGGGDRGGSVSRVDAPPARPAVIQRAASDSRVPSNTQPLPSVPTRSASSGKKLPPRPISLKVQDTLITVKCFYKDRRLIQISSSEPSFSDLQEKIRAKFLVSDLEIRYKTASGDIQPIRNLQHLCTAIEADLHEIYLSLEGEVNEFEPQPSSSSYTSSPSPPTPAPTLPSRANGYGNAATKVTASSSQAKATPFTAQKTTTSVTPVAKPATTTNKFGAQKAAATSAVAAAIAAGPGAKAAEKQKKAKSVWQECYTDEGERYFFNTETQETSWDPDIDPSPPWMICKTDGGDKYYYNPDSDASTWEFPG